MPPDRHATSEDNASPDDKPGGKPQVQMPASDLPSPNSTGTSSFLIKDILSSNDAVPNQRTTAHRGFSPPLGASPPMGCPPPLTHMPHPMAAPYFFDHRRPNGSGQFSPPIEDDDDGGHSSDDELSRDAGNGESLFSHFRGHDICGSAAFIHLLLSVKNVECYLGMISMA
ncbi:uncharacterized protein CDAR_417161 [Caerostris darwini]|uniref:Uncharacterized protein n=1 Tax=Caerostris darwini TaxID=1538125 RepID=A0AAV4X8R1_9ARAC|nr:uncharacterized protein CDAR_417161 [Caerostris darwini]